MADDRPQNSSEDSELSANLDRPRRAAPTLDLDAAEVSDKARDADANAEPAEPVRRPMADAIAAGIISTIFGGSAAALVIAAAWWTGWLAEKAPAPPTTLPVQTAAIDALAARVSKVESTVKTPLAPLPDPAVAARIDTTEKSLEALRAELAAARAQSQQLAAAVNDIKAAPAAIDALTARVAKVESSAATPSVVVPDPAVAARFDTTEKSLESIRAELTAALAQSKQLASVVNDIKSAPHEAPPPPPPPTDLSPINDRIAQLEAATKTISAEIAQRNATPPVGDLPLRRVVAATLLDLSVRQGEPYAAALAAAKSLAPSADALKSLEPFAATGVPGVNAMSRELLAMAPKLSPPAPEHSITGSIVDRLEAGAARLVRIQRTDVPIGSDRNAIVARATAAAQRNDIAAARRELNTLSPPDRAALQPWIDKADARDAALSASRQFAADMMATLPKPAP